MTTGPGPMNHLDILAGGGEMGERLRGVDWTRHRLGPIELWPHALRASLSICLNTAFPIAIYWGPDAILLYNDAWRPIVGNKHPWALGRPGREVWSEIWDVVGPVFDRVMASGQGSFQSDALLSMYRHGYTEECYFDYTFSPIRGEGGAVEGVFNAVTETTFRVLSDRRSGLLRELAAQAAGAKTLDEACHAAARALATDPHDVPFSLIYLVEGGTARLAGSHGITPGCDGAPARVELGADAEDVWELGVALQGDEGRVVDLDGRATPPIHAGPWPEPVTRAYVRPVGARGGDTSAVIVLGISPRRALDEAYEDFCRLAGVHLSAAFDSTHAFELERKRAESLAEIDRAKTAFFSNVSHELRTPLTLMLGPLQDVLSRAHGELPNGAVADLKVAHRNTLRLAKLVNTLLDFSRVEAGRLEAVYEATDLAALTTDLASTFRSAIEKAGMTLAVDCPPLGEPVYVDRSMWEKIVLNLLSNAFKYTMHGEIRVTLRVAGEHVELSVADTGAGIPAEAMPRLFERFYRAEDATGRTHEGTGIGLALVHDLSKLHGGEVAARSEVGKGSTFTVTIPRGTSHLPHGRVQAARSNGSVEPRAASFVDEALSWIGEDQSILEETSADEAAPTARADDAPTVLVADDNGDMRGYIERLLSARYRVVAVRDGEEALQAACRDRPDLVVTDVMMPRLDGFGLLRALRDHPSTASIPVILLSARAGEEARIEGLARGADDYLVKPFSARELVARVESQLQLSRVRGEAERAVRESEERFRALFDSMDEGYCVIEVRCDDRTQPVDYRFLETNPAFARQTGLEEVRGRWVREIAPDLEQYWFDIYAQVAQTGESVHFERPASPFGRHFEVSAFRVGDPSLRRVGVVFNDITERKRTEALIASELADAKLLQAVSTAIVQEQNTDALYDQILDAAASIMQCDFATLQMLYPERGDAGELRLLAFRGFDPQAAEFWKWVRADSQCICGEALRTRQRAIASDVLNCDFLTGTDDLAEYRKAGIGACQSTPLISRSGTMIGMISTHWKHTHEPSERDLRLLDILARQAADLLERRKAEEALSESEARFRALTNATSDVVYRMNADWTEMHALDGREFISDTLEPSATWLDRYIHPDDQSRVREAFREAIETRSDFNLEHRVIRVDGSLGWTHSHAIPICDERGEILEWFGAASDITRRKQAEEELGLREILIAGQREALELALNEAPLPESLGALVRTTTAVVGGGVRAAFYLANEQKTALHHVVGMCPDYAKAVDGFTIGPDSLACGLATHTGRPILTSDVKEDPLWSSWLWMAERFDYRACWSFPIHTAKERFIGTLAVYSSEPRNATERDVEVCALLTHTASMIISRDVESAARRHAELMLRESESRHRQTLSLLPAAVYSCNADGVITYYNQQAAELWGREPVVGHADERFCAFEKLLLSEDKLLPHDECPMALALSEGRSFRNEDILVQRPDGSRLYVSVNIDPIRDEDGVVVGAVNAFRDVTSIKRAEDILRQSEERFRNIFTSSNDAIFVVDPQSDAILDANPKATAMLGYSREELLALSMSTIHPEEMEQLRKFAQDVFERGQGWTDELSCLTRDGSFVPVEMSASRFVDSAGRTCLLALVRDITDRKTAERALRESERRFHMLADNIDQLAWTCDERLGNVTWYNQRWLDYTGLTFDEMKAWGWMTVQHPDHIDRIVASVERAAETGTPWDETLPLRGKDGSYRWFLSRAIPIRDESGTIVSWFGTNTDVTSLREVEQSLRQSEERFRTFTDTAPAMLWVTDRDGSCTFLSLGWYSYTGQGENEGLGAGWTNAIHPEDREAAAAAFRAANAARSPELSIEFRLRRADGQYRWAIDIGRARFASDGSFLGYVGNVLDVHEQKLNAAELAKHREHLQQMVNERTAELEASHRQLRLSERMAAIGTLSAGLGHDMGNLLVPLRVRLESLASADLPEHLSEDVEAIRNSAEYLRKLSSGLRQLAVDPKQGVKSEVTELRSWWEEAEPMLRNALPPGVALDADIGEQSCWVQMSRAALTQAVFNLVQNAGDAMRERGSGKVTVRSDRGDGTVRLLVSDDGPGMTPEVRARCMEPFFTTKTRGLSTGMGLALVYGIINDVGGSITVDSQLDRGTTFCVSLPEAAPPDSPESTAERIACVEVRDPRMRAIVSAELRSLEFDVRRDAEDDRAELLVLDEAARINGGFGGRPVVLLADPGETVYGDSVIATGARPAPRVIREALRQAMSFEREREA